VELSFDNEIYRTGVRHQTVKVTICRLPYNAILGIKKSAYPLWAGYLFSSIEDFVSDGKISLNFVDGETLDYGINPILLSNSFINKFLVAFFPRLLINFDRLRRFAFDIDHPVWNLLIDKVLENGPDLVAISAYTNELAVLRSFVKIVKNRSPKCIIIVGGIHVTVDYQNLSYHIPGIDYYCIGEGEVTFREAILAYLNHTGIQQVPGIYTPKHPQKYIPRDLVLKLDTIKPPNRTLGFPNAYRDEFHIFSSRGCPFQCNFCSSFRMWSRKTRFHSVERVIAEIEDIVEKQNGSRIIFVDDTFTLNRKRVFAVMDALERKRYGHLNMHVGSRIDTLDEKMLDILARGGVKSMSFGIESGSAKIQKLSKKGLDKKRIIKTLQYAKTIGIHTLAYFIVGHPEETEEDMEATIDLIRTSRATKVSVCAMQPLPGTEIFEKARKKGFAITLENSLDMDQHAEPVINLTHMSDDLLKRNVRYVYKIANKHSQRGRAIQGFHSYISMLRKELDGVKFGTRTKV